jgi:hypothetical protein
MPSEDLTSSSAHRLGPARPWRSPFPSSSAPRQPTDGHPHSSSFPLASSPSRSPRRSSPLRPRRTCGSLRSTAAPGFKRKQSVPAAPMFSWPLPAACRISSSAGWSTSRPSRSSFSTRRIACSTWGFGRRWTGSFAACRGTARRCSSPRRSTGRSAKPLARIREARPTSSRISPRGIPPRSSTVSCP